MAGLKDRTTAGQAGWGGACTQKAKAAASSAGPGPDTGARVDRMERLQPSEGDRDVGWEGLCSAASEPPAPTGNGKRHSPRLWQLLAQSWPPPQAPPGMRSWAPRLGRWPPSPPWACPHRQAACSVPPSPRATSPARQLSPGSGVAAGSGPHRLGVPAACPLPEPPRNSNMQT